MRLSPTTTVQEVITTPSLRPQLNLLVETQTALRTRLQITTVALRMMTDAMRRKMRAMEQRPKAKVQGHTKLLHRRQRLTMSERQPLQTLRLTRRPARKRIPKILRPSQRATRGLWLPVTLARMEAGAKLVIIAAMPSLTTVAQLRRLLRPKGRRTQPPTLQQQATPRVISAKVVSTFYRTSPNY
eukprot:Rmarinus@m.4731